jgi:hypothetical protein
MPYGTRGMLLDAHEACPDCGSESLTVFREDKDYGPPGA